MKVRSPARYPVRTQSVGRRLPHGTGLLIVAALSLCLWGLIGLAAMLTGLL